MLILSREQGERIRLTVGGETVWLEVVRLDRNRAAIGITAPLSVECRREELLPAEEHFRATVSRRAPAEGGR